MSDMVNLVINEVDRISNLPEPILIQILSLLPTKDSVATSSLSTNWKFLWKDIRTLHFNDTPSVCKPRRVKEQLRLFACFVNHVFKSLDTNYIDKFYLNIHGFSEGHSLTNWIDSAVSRNPKVIKVYVTNHINKPFDMPCNLYTCNTLEVLHLDSRYIQLNLPSLISLPNLKTLSLRRLIYNCEKTVLNLISGCSSLENLYITESTNIYVFKSLIISSPTLRNLSLILNDNSHFRGYKTVINAPELRVLNINTPLTRNFCVENLCLLNDASISVFFGENGNLMSNRKSNNLLQQLYNVKNLSLGRDILMALDYGFLMPKFSRLSRLTADFGSCQWKLLLNLLESSDKLVSLTLSMFFRYKDVKPRYKYVRWRVWIEPEIVPVCLLSCLQTVSLLDMKGGVDELEMVAYMLENAKVLKTMTIHLNTKAKDELIHKITKYPRGSEKCQVIFT